MFGTAGNASNDAVGPQTSTDKRPAAQHQWTLLSVRDLERTDVFISLARGDWARLEPIAYAEIKGWWSTKGEDEIPEIRHDMNVKLGGRLGGGVMLILGSHGTANAEDCFRLLADKLAVPRDRL